MSEHVGMIKRIIFDIRRDEEINAQKSRENKNALRFTNSIENTCAYQRGVQRLKQKNKEKANRQILIRVPLLMEGATFSKPLYSMYFVIASTQTPDEQQNTFTR